MEENNSTQLKGKWVIFLDEHIIASGDDIQLITAEAKEKYPDKKLVLARIPEEGTMIY
jgi:hypothetical protein